jgi:hypothetical protein
VLIDVVIALLVLGGAWLGFKHGFVQPLLAEVFSLGSLAVLLHVRDGFAGLMQALFHANGFLTVLMGLIIVGVMGFLGARLGDSIRKMPAVLGVDGFVGIWLQTAAGALLAYLLISGMILIGRAAPTPSLNVGQVRAAEATLGSNPFTAGVLGSADQTALALQARKAPVAAADIPVLGGLRGLYDQILEPQLASSHLASRVMGFGQHVPGFGALGPRDLPGAARVAPSSAPRATSPSPSAAPRR